MSEYEILDTFPAFRRYWRKAGTLGVDQQIATWSRDYLNPWPELLRKQVDNYEELGVDWKAIARRRIFPTLDGRLDAMATIRDGLRRAIPIAVRRCRDKLGLDFPVTFAIHVGIGCGAGWATKFRGTPAILFGLENAAELGWTDPATVVALVEHEIAHLLHDRWRQRAGMGGLEDHRGPWWQLYDEGFATRCELLLGEVGQHHARGPNEDWLTWCTENRSRLASLFLKATGSPTRIRRFFGSWYPLEEHVETGYFLGSEVVRDWERTAGLREIALWPPDRVRRRARSSLERIAADRTAPPPRIRES